MLITGAMAIIFATIGVASYLSDQREHDDYHNVELRRRRRARIAQSRYYRIGG